MNDKVDLGMLPTGVPGLDILLGGGLSEFSFTLIAGAPGSGKTTLAHQIMFSLAGPQRRAIFFTVLGEPPLKMLRYQQQYSFFDVNKVGESIRYVNLAEDLRSGDFNGVMRRIAKEVEDFTPSLVFVDSFRSVVQTAREGSEGVTELQHFVQELGTRMTSWQATTFLIGEYANPESEVNPILTVADGMISLSQNVETNSVVRKLRIFKMRGQAHMAGFHTFRMGRNGIQVFPRLLPPLPDEPGGLSEIDPKTSRVSTGIPKLDDMLHGGIPVGHSVLVVGPTGCGKTILGTGFLQEGARAGEHGLVVRFEKGASRARNVALERMVQAGQVTVVKTHLIDLTVEEIVEDLVQAIRTTGATRVVLDSLSELDLYLAPESRHDFRESVFRILSSLARLNVTVIVTLGLEDRFTDMRFSHSELSFLADAVIGFRYVELRGELKRLLSVVKVRGSSHSIDLREFTIGEDGIEISERIANFEGLLSGHATQVGNRTNETD
ncbi:MAG: protein kinase [Herminiimonas sp.]|nr:protein kinase [Herminiimonas sp.]